jgi:hypothetical protein
MGFLVSPGVEIKETDLTDIVPAQSTSIGGYAGYFRWGPSGRLVTVGSETDLAKVFGTPEIKGEIEVSFLTAASFLKYGNSLKVARAVNGSYNATSGGAGMDTIPAPAGFTGDYDPGVINGQDDLDRLSSELLGIDSNIVARYAGSLGNSLRVYFITEDNWDTVDSTIKAQLGYKPTNTVWAENLLGDTTAKDEIHVLVVDQGGAFSGDQGSILEIYQGLSMASNAKDEFGESNYWVSKLNGGSSYVWAVRPTEEPILVQGALIDFYAGINSILQEVTETTGTVTVPVEGFEEYYVDLADGMDDADYTADPVVEAIELFGDYETVDVNLIFAQNFTELALDYDYVTSKTKTVDDKLLEIANTRKDCMAFLSAPLKVKEYTNDVDRLNEVLWKFEGKSGSGGVTSTSYAVFDSTPAYVYNRYKDQYVWIPLCGHIAGLCANTDNVSEPWFSPAGLNRGNIQSVIKLAYNPKQADRDELYKKRVNPVVSFPGQGIVLYGDKTALARPSAFDRINVRRLFMTVEKAIATSAKFQLFEINDEFTRSAFVNAIAPFLRDVQGRRGIEDFKIVCDSSNNTSQVVDGNRFVADIYIKPLRSINFITLNFIATRTGAIFEELV